MELSSKQGMTRRQTQECVVPLIWPESGQPSELCPAIVLTAPESDHVVRRLPITKVNRKFLGGELVKPAVADISSEFLFGLMSDSDPLAPSQVQLRTDSLYFKVMLRGTEADA